MRPIIYMIGMAETRAPASPEPSAQAEYITKQSTNRVARKCVIGRHTAPFSVVERLPRPLDASIPGARRVGCGLRNEVAFGSTRAGVSVTRSRAAVMRVANARKVGVEAVAVILESSICRKRGGREPSQIRVFNGGRDKEWLLTPGEEYVCVERMCLGDVPANGHFHSARVRVMAACSRINGASPTDRTERCKHARCLAFPGAPTSMLPPCSGILLDATTHSSSLSLSSAMRRLFRALKVRPLPPLTVPALMRLPGPACIEALELPEARNIKLVGGSDESVGFVGGFPPGGGHVKTCAQREGAARGQAGGAADAVVGHACVLLPMQRDERGSMGRMNTPPSLSTRGGCRVARRRTGLSRRSVEAYARQRTAPGRAASPAANCLASAVTPPTRYGTALRKHGAYAREVAEDHDAARVSELPHRGVGALRTDGHSELMHDDVAERGAPMREHCVEMRVEGAERGSVRRRQQHIRLYLAAAMQHAPGAGSPPALAVCEEEKMKI
ncbi:hypothetical protein B0H15DRAFT_804126 [Mycena belliarum]|uniref:Uncharacterized protein n=1 Tax=Mycena belliarum TaxID=1033014 RepID=A0AAD6XQC4_9AGAR|nr:hypothetical protein B0H15DRAFT_804126 [Mycena belliae]